MILNSDSNQSYYFLDTSPAMRAQIKREREKARALRKTHWWLQQVAQGVCAYCGKPTSRENLTMDHRVPLARGGKSTRGNIVPACKACNQSKKLETPAEIALSSLAASKAGGLALLVFVWGVLSVGPSFAQPVDLTPPSSPISELIPAADPGLNYKVCAEWNPDFSFRGSQCCGATRMAYRNRTKLRCSPSRAKATFCDEMTDLQRDYVNRIKTGKITDILEQLQTEKVRAPAQSYCGTSNGFLVNGRPVMETGTNHIKLKRPDRCVNFGTDRMVGMLEWLGREVGQFSKDPETRLVVGDISAPRGGCLMGKGGRSGHRSHTKGQDVDLGFLEIGQGVGVSRFSSKFDSNSNWWMVKKLFNNSYACIERVFLDRHLIRSLEKAASGDLDWPKIRPYLQHVKAHKNHFHVRIGNQPGPWACSGAGPASGDQMASAEI